MKCEGVFESLETGATWRRIAARLHLRRCRECQVACRQLASLKLELSRGEPLDDRRRRKWLAVAGSTPVESASRAFRPAVRWIPVSLACAFMAIAAAGIWYGVHRSGQDLPRPGAPDPMASVVDVSGERAWLELADVRNGLDELSRELDELALQVDLMDEEREVQELLARYALEEDSKIRGSSQ